MQKFRRWEDYVALVAGAYAILSPIWTDTSNKATWTMVVLGAITVAVSLYSMAMPDDRMSEYTLTGLGVLFFIAPWVMQYTDMTAMSVTAWVVGVVTLVMGGMTVPEINRLWHHAPSH